MLIGYNTAYVSFPNQTHSLHVLYLQAYHFSYLSTYTWYINHRHGGLPLPKGPNKPTFE